MSVERRMHRLGIEEAELAAACRALSSARAAIAPALSYVGDEHARAAERLMVAPSRLREALAAARALGALLLGPHAAAEWLREREHKLVRGYLALDTVAAVDDVTRRTLRRELIPAAYDRYTRVDRLVAAAEIEAGAPA